MSDVIQQGVFRELDPGALIFSKSLAQTERRKHFDREQLKELIASVREKGIVQPIVVRPNGSPETFEVVAGERRVLAAREAGLKVVPAMVHQLDDDQALDVQLIENLQREDLHPLVEAEGYDDLTKRGHSIAQIADKVGKSPSYVYKRLELAGCLKPVRSAFFDKKIDASRALLLATIKDPDQQLQCLKDFTAETSWRPAMSYRQCVEHVKGNYRLSLSGAPFKTEDAALVPAAGACSQCPKNTSRQPADLFGDVSKNPRAMCTDAKCYGIKTAAAAAVKVAAATAAGQTVIEGPAAAKIIPENSYKRRPVEDSGFVSLDDVCHDDAKNRTFRQMVGKHVTPTLVVTPKDSQVTEVISKADFKKACKDHGIKVAVERSSSSSTYTREQREKQKKAKTETKFRNALYDALRPKLPTKLGSRELSLVAETMLEHLADEGRKAITRIWLPDYQGERYNAIDAVRKKAATLGDSELVHIILDCCYVEKLHAYAYNVSKAEGLLEAAKRARIDVDRIRKECAPAAPPKAKGKKAAKKK